MSFRGHSQLGNGAGNSRALRRIVRRDGANLNQQHTPRLALMIVDQLKAVDHDDGLKRMCERDLQPARDGGSRDVVAAEIDACCNAFGRLLSATQRRKIQPDLESICFRISNFAQ